MTLKIQTSEDRRSRSSKDWPKRYEIWQNTEHNLFSHFWSEIMNIFSRCRIEYRTSENGTRGENKLVVMRVWWNDSWPNQEMKARGPMFLKFTEWLKDNLLLTLKAELRFSITHLYCDGTFYLVSTKRSVQPDGPPCIINLVVQLLLPRLRNLKRTSGGIGEGDRNPGYCGRATTTAEKTTNTGITSTSHTHASRWSKLILQWPLLLNFVVNKNFESAFPQSLWAEVRF